CRVDADDIAYLGAVLDEVEAQFHVDPSRIYVMGFSNGGAMSNRVACEMADRVAAVASLSGTNEFATAAPCEPARPIPVLHAHGTDDPCWTYETSTRACADESEFPKLGVAESIDGWLHRLGCAPDHTSASMP